MNFHCAAADAVKFIGTTYSLAVLGGSSSNHGSSGSGNEASSPQSSAFHAVAKPSHSESDKSSQRGSVNVIELS